MSAASHQRVLPQRILAVGAHPDDIELLCAGTLVRFLQLGSTVNLAIACRGDRGGSHDPAWGMRREDEARAAAEILGAPVEFLRIGDADVRDTPAVREQFIGVLRRARPDLVITHAPNDYHDDHVRVSDIVCKCCWFAASVGHVGNEPPLASAPAVVYMDTVAAIGFEPTHLVDISNSLEIKRRMLACHVSQTTRPDAGMHQLDELLVTQARLRGFQAGVQYAEGFSPALLFGRRRPEPLLP